MNLTELFLFLFASAGMTFTIVYAEILDILKIRPFLMRSNFIKKMITCSFCTAYYTGLLICIIYGLYDYIFIFPFASSAFVFLWDRTTTWLIYNTPDK